LKSSTSRSDAGGLIIAAAVDPNGGSSRLKFVSIPVETLSILIVPAEAAQADTEETRHTYAFDHVENNDPSFLLQTTCLGPEGAMMISGP
jgi:hypothetical protein